MYYFYLFLAFAIGVTNTVQGGVNSQLRLATGNPILSGVISFGTGFVGLLVCYALFNKAPVPPFETFKQLAWWKWSGGILGAFFIMTVIFVVRDIGSANLVCLIVAGQLVASLALDHFGLVGFAVHPVNAWRLLGVVLVGVGAYLVVKN